eukprot:TRINITY_DN9606_c0_g1_i1.p2 TRINITY_DN9606_c0_g1~~TRINITY_DN9606_c0_g1_i1.p2  ORF type:complete len:92 (-),score=15.86 TRINITY_DN9606_c0_g1_i1:57-332(-)
MDSRCNSIGCVADICGAFGASMGPYVEALVPHLLKCIQQDNSLLQQNATFCFGVLCQNCGDRMAKFYEAGLTAFQPIMQHGGENEATFAPP